MTHLQAIILGLVEGLTEFIPVSSSAHLVIVRQILNLQTETGLAFDAIVQSATVLAVIVYFWKDITHLVRALFVWICKKQIEQKNKVLIVSIIAGTVPAAVIGLVLEKYIESSFRSVFLVIGTLVAGSIVFFAAEWFYKRKQSEEPLTVKKGFLIGLLQSLAVVPGMSRSGMTISGGLFFNLSRGDAARFSFLLSLPIIVGSGLKKLLDLSQAGLLSSLGSDIAVASFVAFVSGLAAIYFLMKYLKTHTLLVFAWYRLLLAAILIAVSVF